MLITVHPPIMRSDWECQDLQLPGVQLTTKNMKSIVTSSQDVSLLQFVHNHDFHRQVGHTTTVAMRFDTCRQN